MIYSAAVRPYIQGWIEKPASLQALVCSLIAATCLCMASPTSICAQEAQWIWSPEHPRGQATEGDCYFRKSIVLGGVEEASVTLTADDEYELFVNGQRVAAGNSINQLEQHEISRFLGRGRNVIAVRVRNLAPGPAALAARVFIKPVGKDWLSYSSDASWRTALDNNPSWQLAGFNDSRWKPAQAFGMLGQTAPWDRREEADPQRLSENQRFRIAKNFAVDEILGDDVTGSLVNMTFNEFGHVIAAQEGGPLLLIYDSNKDGVVDKVREYCDLVDGIQGIMALNGDVFVTGMGPEGNGVYRLIDKDRNGALEKAEKIVSFTGESSEHGAHALTLGPDGKIYCTLGNHVQLAQKPEDTSPYQNYYEGDLLRPKYEDPGGHARGIKAPGGTVVRFDVDGENVEVVAGGIRNAFDLAFHPDGRLFIHDSDMESDEGATWYRPTSLYEIVEGGEYGWRSGWSKWPTYYYDRMPTLMETGRGSPTGACAYDHHMFPVRFQKSLFLADWTKGQIICVRFDDEGNPQSEVFIEGQPLNVTDLAVGPDGWIYFCTGGRGTKGGIYQVKYLGDVPESVRNLGSGITQAVKQPQLNAAWARQAIATLKREMGSTWGDTVAGVAFSDDNPAKYRLRALDLMQLFGPAPSTELLLALSETPSEPVRARAAKLLGNQADSSSVVDRLEQLLGDPATTVQIAASEGLLKSRTAPSIEALRPLLASLNRRVAWTARRLLEITPTEQWRFLLEDENQRIQLQAGLALVIVEPKRENGLAIVNMVNGMLDGFISDRNFIDLLRLAQVTLNRIKLGEQDLAKLAQNLQNEFPIGEPVLNRELFQLLAYLNADSVIPQAISYLQREGSLSDQLQIAMQLRYFDHDWTTTERFEVLKFFEKTSQTETGSSIPLYVMNITRDIAKDLPLEEARIFVSEGKKWPNAALVSLYQYPEKLSPEDLTTLKTLDQEIDQPGMDGEEYKRLRTGIVAMLSQHGSEDAQEYLREIWIRSPERRQAVALGLSMFPTDPNWDYLVRSLPVLESFAVPEILNALKKIPAATHDAQAVRDVILHGLRMEENGQSPGPAISLLKYWTGEDLADSSNSASKLTRWQTWYSDKFPDQPDAVLPVMEQSSPWNMETLTEYFASADGRRGDVENGMAIYEKADCAKCHRMGQTGTAVGPDLTTLASRFTKKEVIESMLFPSHVISDQYQTQKVLTSDGKVYVGMVAEQRDGTLVVRDSNLETHTVAAQDLDQLAPSKVSLMPSGLLDTLSAAEIRDLMTYLGFGQVQQVARDSGSGDSIR